jgi:hypothetical protein
VNEKKIEIVINHQLIKDKILPQKDLNWPKRRYQLVRRDDLADQGGAVVPDTK